MKKKKHDKNNNDSEHNNNEKKKELTVRIENKIEKKETSTNNKCRVTEENQKNYKKEQE